MSEAKVNKKKYLEHFSKEKPACADSKLAMAFEKAHDIRKFEIELYWKRTTYFWTLLAAIFAGYFVLLSTDNDKIPYKDIYLTLVACIGFVFAFAWHLAAKGSKFWQENWESHLDMLEDDITGPLYKTVLKKSDCSSGIWSSCDSYSVSKVNHWISIFLIFTWIGLMTAPLLFNILDIFSLYALFLGIKSVLMFIAEIVLVGLTFYFVWLMTNNSRTKFRTNNLDGKITAIERTTNFDDDKAP